MRQGVGAPASNPGSGSAHGHCARVARREGRRHAEPAIERYVRAALPPVEISLDRQRRVGDFRRCELEFHARASRRRNRARSAERTVQRPGRSVEVDIGERERRRAGGGEIQPAFADDHTIQRDAVGKHGERGAQGRHRGLQALVQRQDRAFEVDLAEAELTVEQSAERQLETHPVAHQRRLVAGARVADLHSLGREVGRGQQPDLDRSRDRDGSAQTFAELLLDEAALGGPVDEERRHQRRRERGDESDRDERQKNSHGVRVTRSFELGSRGAGRRRRTWR